MDPVSTAIALAQFAPKIIKWLGGSDKASEVAADVVDMAKTVTGAGSGEAAVATLQADPAMVLQFQEHVAAMAADMDKAYLADRADARRRDAELAKAGRKNTRADMMVILDVVGLLLSLLAMLGLGYMRAQYPTAVSEGMFGALLAQLTALASFFGMCLRDAHQFEFGSSRGSRDKDELLAARSQD